MTDSNASAKAPAAAATTAEPPRSAFRLAVLNPGGRNKPVSYRSGPGAPGDHAHPPINFHAYAAATGGDFLVSTSAALSDDHDAVLVLIRNRVGKSLDAVRELKQAGRTVLVSWKESGPYQITRQLGSSKALAHYQEILSLADGVLSPTIVLPPRWGWISAEDFTRKTRFIPTPYPLEFADWDFSLPIEERRGIFIGTREFFIATRNHLRTLAESATLTAELGVPVTVVNSDKRAGRRILRMLEESFPEASLRIIDRPLPYRDYLQLIASHKLVFQLDRGGVPGQVAGDCLLCGTLCAGGNTAIERLAFPDLADDGSGSLEAPFDRVRHLLRDDKAYAGAVEESKRLASERVSYQAVARQLEDFVGELSQEG